jgi:chromosome segregation ATPase
MTRGRRGQARALALAALGVVLSGGGLEARAQSLDTVLAQQAAADDAAAASQREIDQLHDEAQGMAEKYRQALSDAASLEKYNRHLAVQVKSQADEVASIRKQLADIETTDREVQPLMQTMVETLEQFVTLDVPFLLEERTRRVATLKEMMARADVTISEKYRRILEAYQIEMEYGRTLEAWEGKVGEGEAGRTVEFVRVGRISLMYQTIDGNETAYWDAQQKAWVVDDDYREAVTEAMRVAKKRGAPDLLRVPVPAPQEAKS